MSIAFVFPGQGSQAPRMGLDWASSSETSGDLYGWASTCLGWDLTKMLESASPDELRQTYIAQPAIFAVSVAALRAWRGAGIRPAFVAGHSLGELSALVAARALSFEAGLTLVARRAEAMQRAADARPGSMSSILGLSVEGVEMAVTAARDGDVLAIANDNAPGNVVVSGEWPALERLPVTAKELRALLARQLTGPVRWTESVRRLADLGVDTFIEVGPGTVLSGLIKRTVQGVQVLSVGDAKGVAEVVEALRERGDGTSGNGGDQGEVVVLPERFAVSPSHGRFYPAALSRFTDEGPYVERGDLLGEVRNGAASIPVLSAFRGQVMAHLAWEGELVTPGQILLSLRPF